MLSQLSYFPTMESLTQEMSNRQNRTTCQAFLQFPCTSSLRRLSGKSFDNLLNTLLIAVLRAQMPTPCPPQIIRGLRVRPKP